MAKTVITIDGPAGAGKSTIAKTLANRLNISYLDTGAMYRALTVKVIRLGTDFEDENGLAELARKTSISLGGDSRTGLRVFLDGEDVTEEIRTQDVTNKTFYIACAPKVREIMVRCQREIGARQSIVAEGRDLGTVVFPQADYKFYLDADFEERARRRIRELKEKGNDVDGGQLKQDLQTRDEKDFTRKAGPLKKAEDAIVIDSTFLSIEQVVEKILSYINTNPKHSTG